MTGWFRVTAPTFCCAVRVVDDRVVDAAPVLKWILVRRDRSLAWLMAYAEHRRWALDRLPRCSADDT